MPGRKYKYKGGQKPIGPKNRKPKTNPPVLTEKMQCSDTIDIFTQEDLPSNASDVVVLNEKSPYHCVDLNNFYNYWKSEAENGRDVKNPYTNQKLSSQMLDKIWKKIKKKNKNLSKPIKSTTQTQYWWIDNEQQEVRQPQLRIRTRLNIPTRSIPIRSRENFISNELSQLLDDDSDSDDDNYLIRPAFMNPEPLLRQTGENLDLPNELELEESDERGEIINIELQNEGENLPPLLRNNNILNMNMSELEEHENLVRNMLRQVQPNDRNARNAYQVRLNNIISRRNQLILDFDDTYDNELPEANELPELELPDEFELEGGKKRKSKKNKKVRKHKGINQKTGKLKKGYKYGKKLKSGLREIVKL